MRMRRTRRRRRARKRLMFSVMMDDHVCQSTIDCLENDKTQIPFEVHDAGLHFCSFLSGSLPRSRQSVQILKNFEGADN